MADSVNYHYFQTLLQACDRESRALFERGLRFKLLLFDCGMFTFVILKISLKKINLFQFFSERLKEIS